MKGEGLLYKVDVGLTKHTQYFRVTVTVAAMFGRGEMRCLSRTPIQIVVDGNIERGCVEVNVHVAPTS